VRGDLVQAIQELDDALNTADKNKNWRDRAEKLKAEIQLQMPKT
jgi:hypothetical protein